MSGISTSLVRSAYVAESTPGTIPSTPGFTTLHAGAQLSAKPKIIEGRSRVAQGARNGQGYAGLEVTGSIEGQLIYGVYDAIIETLLQSSFSSDVMKDGKANTTVAIENTMPAGVGGTNTMLRYRGVEAVGGSISLTSNEAAAFNFSLIGLGSDDATTTAISGATYSDPSEADPLSSGEDVGAITFNGYTLDCMESLEIDFAFEGRDPQPKVSSNDLCGVSRGDFLPKLMAKMYIEANFLAIYNAARSRHTAFAVTVPLGSVSGEKYTLLFPQCTFGSTEIDTSGTNVFQQVEILPQYNTSAASVLTLTRAVS
tara:strand:+ start:284 stop:1222 length:939 start_codon:yes stop_codon:yes gene_type:complete